MVIEARFWSTRNQQWYYLKFSTVEDMEEYQEEIGQTAARYRIDKGDWKNG